MEDNISPAAGASGSGGLVSRSLAEAAVDFDLMDEFFAASGLYCSDVLPPSAACASSTGPFAPHPFLHILDESSNGNRLASQDEDDESNFPTSSEVPANPPLAVEGWHIQPRGCHPRGPVVTVQQRLVHSLRFIREAQRDRDALIQIWVPITEAGGRQVLTTMDQPFSLDSSSQRLVNYRRVSTEFQFLADERSRKAVGLPGRVFLEKVPEWTPDVRYFHKNEYPRVGHAKHLDVRGTIALPIFERDNRTCLGVVEVVTTTQKINYGSDVESICNALRAVDLRSAEVSSVSNVKVTGDCNYQAALPEIQGVLRVVCEAHNLPLAQTWISCIQQGKRGSRHSDEKYRDCISTVDAACYIQDTNMLDFHQACSEHHLFRGQGIAGKAFLTNQPCFSPDITAFSKIDYPLSHHAKLFNLRAAVAIRLRSIHTKKADYVLEFFLPTSCLESEEQKLKLNSLSITIQKVCRSLRVVTAEELEEEALFESNKMTPSVVLADNIVNETSQGLVGEKFLSAGSPATGVSLNSSSWITNTLITQQKGVKILPPVSAPLELNEQKIGGFSLSTHWQPPLEVALPAGSAFSVFNQNHADFSIDHKNSYSGEPSLSNAERFGGKKRTKTEKSVSLQELQKYFAGSLKDAAKSLGVCPTTLKRICRQHGIPRWPSRKIKKVGHSLKKLQVVIDSVHGHEGSFKLSSLYENFTKANWSENSLPSSSTFSSLKQKDPAETLVKGEQQQEGRFKSNSSQSNSLSSSSCSKTSSSSLGYPIGDKQHSPGVEVGFCREMLAENRKDMLNTIHNQVYLHEQPDYEVPKSATISPSNTFLSDSGSLSPSHINRYMKIKATNGEDKIVFRLHPDWGFQDVMQEIMKRFSIADPSFVDLKYLDDDSEWVLLTCDADLEECIEVYKFTGARTIKISVNAANPTIRSSFGSTGLY